MKNNYKLMWLRLRKQMKEDLERAKYMHEKSVKNFNWSGYGNDWDEIESIMDWQHEESKTECMNEILDEIEGKKCHTCIMTEKEFKDWKQKIKKGTILK
jgi:hypothetical protein